MYTMGVLLDAVGKKENFGKITIITNALPDGTRTHTVLIPGTQTWANPELLLDDPNSVFDGQGAVLSHFGIRTELAERVQQAMQEHGIAAEDPVMLMGHSQGGYTAANLANDPSFRSLFNVEAVVAVGSYGPAVLPADIDYLEVIDPADPMGRVGSAHHGQVLQVDNSLGWIGSDANPFDHHDMSRYAHSLDQAVRDGRLDSFQTSHSGFFPPAGSDVTASRYELDEL
jgi:pimeloyl-ACP methyl ester carboxylesterase